jgi:hypothetical protein
MPDYVKGETSKFKAKMAITKETTKHYPGVEQVESDKRSTSNEGYLDLGCLCFGPHG